MAKFEFKLPDIGEGVTEGEIVGWLAKVGDQLAENQDMIEVMTDKATVTIGAPKAGRVIELRGAAGDTVPVGAVIVVLELGASDVASAEAESPARPSAPNQLRRARPRRCLQRPPTPVRLPRLSATCRMNCPGWGRSRRPLRIRTNRSLLQPLAG
jgi:pyruvate/2-oxoglutarate dehydrogenase complex dihydrolipoamide acyltransferase (E2) component